MPRKPGHAGTKEADPPWATLPERRRCAIDNKIKGLRVFTRAAPEPGVALRRWWLLGRRPATPDQIMTVQPAFPPISSVTASTREFTRARFLIEDVYPSIEQGRYPVKRIQGDPIEVWADIFRDGHDVIAAALVWRRDGEKSWHRGAMRLHDNDRWTAS